MNIQALLNGETYNKPNPLYNSKTKKLGAPKFIPTTESQYSPAFNIVNSITKDPINESIDTGGYTLEQLGNYDITPTNVAGTDYQKELSESQSNWSKAFNALAQTVVSEVGIGTVKAFSDMADALIAPIFESDNDYTNPVSQTLQNWQDAFNNKVAPVYTKPGVDISNGGLADLGWWLSNMPSIMSSLTLLIPGTAAAKTMSWLAKASKLGKGTRNAMRAIGNANKHLNWINDSENIARGNAGLEMFTNAAAMRAIENYQEARGTYTDVYSEANNTFAKMSDADYNNYIQKHPQLLNDDGTVPDKDTAAKRIASQSADKTFVGDLGNVVFDVIQLYALKDIGKNLGFVKPNKSRVAKEAHTRSMKNLNATTEEAVENNLKTNNSKYWNYIKGHAKDWGKDLALESTEGIEEAVNYIAQQEGINYGKVLLENEKPSTFDSRFKDYMKNPQLYESAFWGWLGGIVFEGGGSAIEKAKLAHTAKKINEDRAKNAKTEEERQAILADNKWLTYLETTEDQAAIAAIEERNNKAKQLKDNIVEINNGVNIFGKPDEKTGLKPKFEGTSEDIELAKEMAKAKLIQNYRASLALDAATSGTYDMLREYVQNESFKKYMVDNKIVSADKVDEFVAETLSTMDSAVNTFRQQLTHVREQANYLNSKKGARPIPLDYVNLIAKENTDHLMNIEDLNSRIKVAELEAIEAANAMTGSSSEENKIKLQEARKLIEISRYAQRYSMNEAYRKKLEEDTTMSPMQKQIIIADLKRRNEAILNKLIGQDNNISNLLFALRFSDRTQIVGKGYKFSDSFAEKTDEQLMEDYESLVGSNIFTGSGKTVEEMVALADDIKNRYAKVTGGSDGLINSSKKLFDLYHDIGDLQTEIANEESLIATTVNQIANRVDFYNNQNNKARAKLIEASSDVITKLYQKYKDNFNKVEEIIDLAYKGRKSDAEKLANARLTSEEAKDLMKAIDIFNFSSEANDYIYKFIAGMINGFKNIDRKVSVGSGRTSSEPAPATSPETSASPSPESKSEETTGLSDKNKATKQAIDDYATWANEHVTFDTDTHTYFIDGKPVDYSATQYAEEVFGRDEIEGDYSHSSAIGNTMDAMYRDFFIYGDEVLNRNYPNLNKERKEKILEDLHRLRDYLDNRFGKGKYQVITDEIRLATVINTPEGKKTMAGTMDMLVIDDNGDAHIFDFKAKNHPITATINGRERNDRRNYTAQQNIYDVMLETVVPSLKGRVKSLQLVWMDTFYPKITEVEYKTSKSGQVTISDGSVKDVPIQDYAGFGTPKLKDDVSDSIIPLAQTNQINELTIPAMESAEDNEELENTKNFNVTINADGSITINEINENNGVQGYVHDDGTVELQFDELDKTEVINYANSNLFNNPGIDLINEDWAVVDNPIIENVNGEWLVVDRGNINYNSVENMSDDSLINYYNYLLHTSSEDIMNNPDNGYSSEDEVYEEFDKVQTELEKRGFVFDEYGEISTNSSTGGQEQDLEPPTPPVTVPPTIQEIIMNPDNAAEVNVVISGINAAVKHYGKDFDKEKVKGKILAQIPGNIFDKTIVEQVLDFYLEDLSLLGDIANNAATEVEAQAARVVATARFVDITEKDHDFSKDTLFVNSFNDFVDAYCATLLSPTIDGKKVIKVGDLMDFCEKVAKPVFNTDANSIFNVIKGYLDKNEDKYFILDKDDLARNFYTTSSKKDRTDVDDNLSFRIDMSPAWKNSYSTEAARKLKAGDKLTAEVKTTQGIDDEGNTYDKAEKVINIKNVNGQIVGSLSVPEYLSGTQNGLIFVNGWSQQLIPNGNSINSWLKDLFRDIFTIDNTNTGYNQDCQTIRNILIKYQAKQISYKDAVTTFLNTQLVQNLIKESITEKRNAIKNHKQFTNKLFISGTNKDANGKLWFDDKIVDKNNNKVDSTINKMFDTLFGVWNYTQEDVYATKEEREQAILRDLDNWFVKLYNNYMFARGIYETQLITSIDASTELEVSYTNDGELITNTNSENLDEQYNNFSSVNESIALNSEIHLAIADPMNYGSILMSGHEPISLQHITPGSTFIMIKGTNGYVPVKAVGVQLNDSLKKNDGAKMLVAIRNYMMIAVNDYCHKPSKNQGIAKLNRWLLEVFGNFDTNSIGILQGNRGLVKVRTNVIDSAGYTNTYVTFTNNKGEVRYLTLKTAGKHGVSVGFKLTDDANNIIAQSKKVLQRNLDNEDSDALLNIFKDILFNNSRIQISKTGILSDNIDSNVSEGGFFRKENGKFVIDIPGNEFYTPFHAEYDSYQDFLVSNNLIKVNTKVVNGSNFRAKAIDNQRNNKVVHVRPTNEKFKEKLNQLNPMVEQEAEHFDEIRLAPTSSETEAKIFTDLFNQRHDHVGMSIVRHLIPDEYFSDPDFRDLIEELLPRDIIYDPNYNDVERDDKGNVSFTGFLAETAARNKARYSRRRLSYVKDGKVNYHEGVLHHNRVVVGDWFISLLSGNQNEKKEAIAKMIHEQLHIIINNNDNATRKELVNAIRGIYDEFITAFNDRYDANNPYHTYIKQWVKQYSKGIYDLTEEQQMYRLEEFIVESVTNDKFIKFLNETNTTNVGETKKSLFDKIIDFILKYIIFRGQNVNFEVADDKLLRKELNVLAEVMNKDVTETPASPPVEENSASQQQTTSTEEPASTPASEQPSNKPIRKRQRGVTRFTDQGSNIDDNLVDNSAKAAFADTVFLPTDNNDGTTLVNNGNDGAYISSAKQFGDKLSVSEQIKFNALLKRGTLNYRCK